MDNITIEDIVYLIEEHISICRSLYPDSVKEILLECYDDLIDLEMRIGED